MCPHGVLCLTFCFGFHKSECYGYCVWGRNVRVSVGHLLLYLLILFSFYLILYVTGIVCDFETLCDTLYRLTVFINCVFE